MSWIAFCLESGLSCALRFRTCVDSAEYNRHSAYILTLYPYPSKGEEYRVVIQTPAEPGEACLPAGRDPLNNGNVILSVAKNLLNSVRIVEEIPHFVRDRDG